MRQLLSDTMTYSAAELETIGLCICLEALGDIANHALLELRDVSSLPGETEVYFHTSIHEELFLIRLLDFVKEKNDRVLTGVSGSCLDVLKSACVSRSFNVEDSVEALRKPLDELEGWLYHKSPLTIWLPTLDIDASIEASRLDFLRISGNHSKHNLSRLTGVSKDIANILTSHGYSVPLELIPLALDDFREHLEENFFVYYGTWLAELVNNVRWGLQDYLLPIFHSSYTPVAGDPPAYRYIYPVSIQHDIPRQWFWRLMNNVRACPYLKRFRGAHYLKKKSSLE
jgi:hypothetical protein